MQILFTMCPKDMISHVMWVIWCVNAIKIIDVSELDENAMALVSALIISFEKYKIIPVQTLLGQG